jgi:hypothetical protein
MALQPRKIAQGSSSGDMLAKNNAAKPTPSANGFTSACILPTAIMATTLRGTAMPLIGTALGTPGRSLVVATTHDVAIN